MIKAYKYRIYPNREQIEKIEKTINVCRLVYNLALETKIIAWQSARKLLTSYDLCYQLPELKKAYPWMKDVDSQALQASVKNIDKAYKSFFRGAGFPKFKNKRKGVQSFQCPANVRRVDWDNSTLTIPKIDNIPIIIPKKWVFKGQIKNVIISRVPSGKYYASIVVDVKCAPIIKSPISKNTSIGIDVGIKSFVITSDGRSFEANRYLKNLLDRLKCLQRRASKKQKGSNNRKKANLCIAILHERITNQRVNYIQNVTKRLISDNQVNSIVTENLNVTGMLKNRKLSRSIMDASFGKFFQLLKYKCEWYGKNLIVIDRFAPSSKRCSCCGVINDSLILANREWICNACGANHDRDFNAANNILWYGLQQTIFKKQTPVDSRGEPAEMRQIC